MTGEPRGCTCEFEVEHGYPALVDDEKTAVFYEKAAKSRYEGQKGAGHHKCRGFRFPYDESEK